MKLWGTNSLKGYWYNHSTVVKMMAFGSPTSNAHSTSSTCHSLLRELQVSFLSPLTLCFTTFYCTWFLEIHLIKCSVCGEFSYLYIVLEFLFFSWCLWKKGVLFFLVFLFFRKKMETFTWFEVGFWLVWWNAS